MYASKKSKRTNTVPKTARWRRRLKLAKHRSFGFGSIHRNNTT